MQNLKKIRLETIKGGWLGPVGYFTLFLGFFLFLLAILLIESWELVNVISLAGVGLALLLIGINLLFEFRNVVVFLSGTMLSVITVTLFCFWTREITEVVAVSYAAGISLLLVNIIAVRTNKSIAEERLLPTEPKDESVIDKKFDDTLNEYDMNLQNLQMDLNNHIRKLQRSKSDLYDLHNDFRGYGIHIKNEIKKIEDLKDRPIIGILYMVDELEEYLNNSVDEESTDVKKIKRIYNRLSRLLEDEDVKKISVKVGDPYNYSLHEINKDQERPPSARSPKRVKKVLKDGYIRGTETLMPAVVDVEWE